MPTEVPEPLEIQFISADDSQEKQGKKKLSFDEAVRSGGTVRKSLSGDFRFDFDVDQLVSYFTPEEGFQITDGTFSTPHIIMFCYNNHSQTSFNNALGKLREIYATQLEKSDVKLYLVGMGNTVGAGVNTRQARGMPVQLQTVSLSEPDSVEAFRERVINHCMQYPASARAAPCRMLKNSQIPDVGRNAIEIERGDEGPQGKRMR